MRERPRSRGVTWQSSRVTRADRIGATGQSGGTIWICGLPAAGKSTLGAGVEERLVRQGRLAYVLDGDNVRHGLCGDLGFDADSRRENVRRVAEAAALLADAGVVAIVALISPERSGRAAARHLHQAIELPFLEVFVDTPVDVCERRDPKGLYSLARRGVLKNFTGVDAPFEPPHEPDVVVRPAINSVATEIDDVVAAFERLGPT